jgi:hypothetical protein
MGQPSYGMWDEIMSMHAPAHSQVSNRLFWPTSDRKAQPIARMPPTGGIVAASRFSKMMVSRRLGLCQTFLDVN